MAKIKYCNFLNILHEVFTNVKQAGVFHRYVEGVSFPDRIIGHKNREPIHFGMTAVYGKGKLRGGVQGNDAYIQTCGTFNPEMPGVMERQY